MSKIPHKNADAINPASPVVLRKVPPAYMPQVLAIASSTGGQQILTEILSSFKGMTINVPIFITQHMLKDFTVLLADQLSSASDIKCVEASDNMEVTPGTVYIAPGNFHMLVKKKNGKIKIVLSSEPPENFCRPAADPMLRSIIEAYGGHKVLAIVLTGMGSDGYLGCKELCEEGGVVIAQDYESSTVWGMPGKVAKEGLCSFVLPPKQISEKITEIFSGGIESNDKVNYDFNFLAQFIKAGSGINLSKDKHYLMESRLLPIIRKHAISDMRGLVNALKLSPTQELKREVIESLTTNETSFFRDIKPFNYFRDEVMPLLANMPNRKIRIWSAACSSGQEAYSLAMTFIENKARSPGKIVEIIGTDINTHIIEKAKRAVYSQFEVQRGLPITMLMKYFTQEDERWHLKDKVKNMVTFKHLNLLENFTMNIGRFDVVFCRNVLIYFDEPTKKQVLENIAKVLNPGGILFLGGSENTLGLTKSFTPFRDLPGIFTLV